MLDVEIGWVSDPLIKKTIVFGVILIFLFIGIRLFHRVISQKVSHPGSRYRLRKLVSFGGLFLALVIGGSIFSENASKLTVAFGVAGAGIAFALQEVIASVAGWVAINFNNFFKVGDRIMLGGIKGDVIDISVLRTTLMELGDWVQGDLYNGRTVRIFNSFVFKGPVFNYSAEFPFLWDEIRIPIQLISDLKRARAVIEEVAQEVVSEFEALAIEEWILMVKKFMIEDARIQHFTTMDADASKAIFTLRYVTDYKMRRKTKDRLYTEIIERIKNSEGKVLWSYSTLELGVDSSVRDLAKESRR